MFSAAIYQRQYRITNILLTQFLKSRRIICVKENYNNNKTIIYIYYTISGFTNFFCCLDGIKGWNLLADILSTHVFKNSSNSILPVVRNWIVSSSSIKEKRQASS